MSQDFQRITDNEVTHFVNYKKYDSEDNNMISLEELLETKDFLDLLFVKLTGRNHQILKKSIIESFLSVSMGTGYHAPSVLVPRVISSTTKDENFSIINGLIGGLATIGTHHLGSVSYFMNMLVQIKSDSLKRGLYFVVNEYITNSIESNQKIYGFGHPVYNKDPRPDVLMREIRSLDNKVYLESYNELKKQVKKRIGAPPNIDAILGLSYLSLGFEPSHGIYLSFIARSLNMVSHILDEQKKKPFDFLNKAIPLEREEQDGTL